MENKVFGEVKFNSGWETTSNISFNKIEYKIVISADAYYEEDIITHEQEIAYKEFQDNSTHILSQIEKMIDIDKYIPVLLLFRRNGDYGLIFDDKNDLEGGIVVVIKPEMDVLSVDQYL